MAYASLPGGSIGSKTLQNGCWSISSAQLQTVALDCSKPDQDPGDSGCALRARVKNAVASVATALSATLLIRSA